MEISDATTEVIEGGGTNPEMEQMRGGYGGGARSCAAQQGYPANNHACVKITYNHYIGHY